MLGVARLQDFAIHLLNFIIEGVSVNLRRRASCMRRIRLSRSVRDGTSANVNLLYPALALLLTVFAIAPLAYPGFFQSYTGYTAVYNLIDLDGHLSSIFTWSPVWGHAYDFLRMDGPLGYWFAEIVHLAGFSFLAAIKITYALSFLVSAFGMFKLARHVLQNDAAALLASALYVYFPAHIAAVYLRGNFGEAVAWSLFPLALWSLLDLAEQVKSARRDALWCILCYAALMLAQPGLAILFGILSGIWLFVLPVRSAGRRPTLKSPALIAMLAGLALGLVLQLPALLPQSQVSAPNTFVPAFVYPFQLLSASWGTDMPRGSFMENAPYQIGFAALGLTILAVALLLRRPDPLSENPPRRLTWFAVGSSLVLLVLMMPLAAPLWDLGLGLFLQYPFQLLAFVGLLLSLAAASVVLADPRLHEFPLLAALVIVPLLAVYPYLAPEFTDFAPVKPALARFNNDELALLDAKIVRPPGTWRHGATVELDLTWQALKQPNRDYTVFLHILDQNGQPWGATDEKPQGGTLSTLQWVPGRVISGTHSVQIDLNGPPEGYHMELGIYQTATGERAVTETGATELRIDQNRH